MIRHLPFEGVDNFRDYGGYAVAGGRRIRRRFLYRSAGHSRATDADLEALAALELTVVVDLRRQEERLREPSRRPPGFAGRVIAADGDETEEDSWIAHVLGGDLTAEGFRAYMIDYYRRAPFAARHTELFRRYFEALAEAQGPVLIHCAAGKDRTGILAALTHHVAGVHPDDIVHDYLLTNDPDRLARRLPMVTQAIAEMSGRTPPDEAVLTAMGVEPAYLETAFAAMTERHGDLDGYLHEAVGLTPEVRNRLAERILE